MRHCHIIFLFFILVGCTNEIGTIPSIQKKKLIINALLNSENSENDIYLFFTDHSTPKNVEDATIKLYVNDTLSEVIDTCSYNEDSRNNLYSSRYKTNLEFKVGDNVRIEARTNDGEYYAESESTVYPPIEIMKIDTSNVFIEDVNFYSSTKKEATRLKIDLHLNNNAERQYFRVQVKQDNKYIEDWFDGKRISSDIILGCNYNSDMALMNGNIGSNSMETDMDIILPIDNVSMAFTNSYFKNNSYTMILDLEKTLYNRPEYISKTATVQIFSISANEYRYLLSLNAYYSDDDDDSSLLVSPVIFSNNIKGGYGIFAIETPTTYTLDLK